MKVINRNIGTPLLSHYCPVCKNEVFNNGTFFNSSNGTFVKDCEECGTELEFPNTRALLELLNI